MTAIGDVVVLAVDEAGVWSNIKIVSSSVTTNNGGTAVLQDEIDNLNRGVDYLSSDGMQSLELGDKVRNLADGDVYVWMGEDGDVDLATADYTDLGVWKLDLAAHIVPQGINFTESNSMGIGTAVVLNDVSSVVSASIVDSMVLAASLAIHALLSASVSAKNDVQASSSGGSTLTGQGDSVAANGVLATNRILSNVLSTILASTIEVRAGPVEVVAVNSSQITAETMAAMSSGAQSVGVELAFNTVGWGRSNLLFAALDALLGDPLISSAFGGSQPATTTASIVDSTVDATGGVHVSATSTAVIVARIGNEATSAPAAIMGAGGMSAAAVLSSNMVNSAATATIENSVIGAAAPIGGDVAVEASDEATIDSVTELRAEVAPSNDLGAGILNTFVGSLLDDYQFTSHSGMRLVRFGDKVRTDDGTVYRFMGVDADLDLSETVQVYSDPDFWKPLSETSLLNDAITYAALSALGTLLNDDGLAGGADSYFGADRPQRPAQPGAGLDRRHAA